VGCLLGSRGVRGGGVWGCRYGVPEPIALFPTRGWPRSGSAGLANCDLSLGIPGGTSLAPRQAGAIV